MEFKHLPNAVKKEILQKNYALWKEKSFESEGFFPVFQSFKEEKILRDLSGNALKLYLYFGLRSKNKTGESWVSIDSISKYFDKSPRTISNWIKELEKKKLIQRFQLEVNGNSYTFLIPYSHFLKTEEEYTDFENINTEEANETD